RAKVSCRRRRFLDTDEPRPCCKGLDEALEGGRRPGAEQVALAGVEERQARGALPHDRDTIEVAEQEQVGEPAGEHEVHRAPGESSLQLRSIVGRSVDVYREAPPSVIRAPSNDNGLRAESHLETGGRCVDQAD